MKNITPLKHLTLKAALLSFVLFVSSYGLMAQTATAPSGTGTSGDPYLIATLNNLYWIADQNNNVHFDFTDKYFKQTANIDASATSSWFGGKGWDPIGNGDHIFFGTYDGQGYTISNLFISRAPSIPFQDYIGLFGYCSGGTIKNLGVTNVSFSGGYYTAGLIGVTDGSVLNCYSTGSIVGSEDSGGLIGYCQGSVSNCYSTCSVAGNSDGNTYHNYGGFIGVNDGGTIINCYATGTVIGDANNGELGGFVGEFSGGTITNCYSTGLVNPAGGTIYGGFSGANGGGTTTGCFWDTQTSGQSASADGTGKTTAEMKMPTTFTGASWSLSDWGITTGVYPYLLFQLRVTTQEVTNIVATTATGNGTILSLGTSNAYAYGICWNTTGNPTISDSKVDLGVKSTLGTFSVSMNGLSANTTYKVRAYVVNAQSTSYGEEISFTTSAIAPTAVSAAASSISSTSATLNGSVNANNATSVVTFDYGTTTGYGSSTTATQSPVNGTSATSVSSSISGLTPNTTYHFRVKAVNTAGTTYGDDATFTTSAISPTATSVAAGSISSTSATLNGSVNANNATSVVTFDYGTTTGYGSSTTATQSPVSGTSATSVSSSISGLTPNTTYHFRVKAVNTAGTTYGVDATFTTSAVAPTAASAAASSISSTSATLNGSVNANGATSVVTFDYGTTTSYGSSTTATQSPVSGTSATSVSSSISGLTPNTTYHFRVKAVNTAGTTYGDDATFTTSAISPTATSVAAGSISSTSATLNGSVNANNATSVVTFDYGTTTGYGSSTTATQSPVSGTSATSVSSSISGLTPNTTYHFRVKAVNTAGTTYGVDATFTTSAIAPTAASAAASSISSTSATLNGSVNANNATSVVTFDYGTSTGYGSSTTATQSPITGSSATSVSGSISGLTPNTTYHFRVKAVNTAGTTYGDDAIFTTITVPGSPTIGTATAGDGQASVSFTAPAFTGGSPITGYTVTSNPGNLTGTGSTSPITVAGLTNGTAYTFTVTATNSAGTSAASVASNSVTPNMSQTITFNALSTKTYGDIAYNLTATSSSGLTVSYSSDNTSVASISGNTVTIVGIGTANITASQVGNSVYLAAPDVIRQLIISKKALNVAALADTKTYDGTTVSTAVPTVGTLAIGDAINTAPTQAFDNASVGTTHVLTASGLTIKNGSTNVTGNYDISYVPATGTINKRGVTVTAVADTKTYDGTTVSTAVPTVGTLVSGDAINTAPTQAFDNASVGTTHVLTASGLTIKNGTTDVTGNYDISYVPATGTINKRGVTVTAVADTKTYDGTTVSTAVPTVGTLVSGDAINTAPTQAFDNASVGTTHVLTASGLTIKNGTTDVTGNYDISYVAATGTINKKAVTVTAVADTKTYDGTTVSTAVPTVGTLVSGDAINTAPTQAFDNASVGTTHVLTASGLTIKNGTTDVTGNYDISYVPATGTINKRGVTVTAVADTKTYDGTTVSTAVPTVGTLATGDAINTAPTQAFDNASVGTTHVLTASGLTIKNGSTNVTGNYDISYVAATGTINKRGVTVTAVADTKTYDGTTVSTAVPTVGTLATGDAINAAPTQSFDNASVGTTHVLTASGLIIKNGSTDVTGNYDISYVPATGTITTKPLTITIPNVTLSKVYDGNTVAAVTAGSLSGLVASDVGKVTVTAVASYDNATVGTNKTITVVYALGGNAAGNYSAPVDFVVTGAEISSETITLQPLSNPTYNANNDLVLSYSVVTGDPTQYKITYEAAALAAGIRNVSYTALATTGTIFIVVPGGTKPGKYKGALQMRNGFGVESATYDFVMMVNIPTEYIVVKYNRVLVFDNSTRIFSAYQWYKNGVAIEGATKQFYLDPNGLVGTYTVQATTIDGDVINSYPKVLNIPLTQKVTAYPSLVRANQTFTVEITDEAMELNLKGAELSVYSSQGTRVYYSTKVEKLNTIKLPTMDGMYSGRLTTPDGQSFLFKVIVAN